MMHSLMLVFVLTGAPAFAQVTSSSAEPTAAPALRSIGVWSNWEAFTLREADTTMCYLVSRPFSVISAVKEQGNLALTVTMWPGRPDTVRLTAHFADTSGTKGELRMGMKAFPLKMGSDGAFVRNAAAAIEEMRQKLQAVANFEEPQGARATFTYSLRGFRAAYAATRRVCPER